MTTKNKILVVVAHSDDETLGCGGTIVHHVRNNDKVFCISFTNGVGARFDNNKNEYEIKKRKASALKAQKILGFKWLEEYCADLPDNSLDAVSMLELIKIIEQTKKKIIPEEILKAKENGKKIIIALGYQTVNNWFESYTQPIANWTAQINFLEDIIKLSRHLNDTFIILRPKGKEWITNTYFKSILNKINDCENIVISNNYKEPFYSYKLCANADLIIAKHTSIADECLSHEIPVLFHDYTHNLKKFISLAFDYSPSGLMCHNFEEILEKSKSLLFNSSSKLKDEISKLNKTIYYVKERGNIKNKIIEQVERLVNST
jgi:hypothetical protein